MKTPFTSLNRLLATVNEIGRHLITSMRPVLHTLFLSLLFISCGNIYPEPHSLKYDDAEFNDIATFILNQYDIHEMDDFTRYYKSINGVPVKLRDDEGDQNSQFLYKVEDSLKLDAKIVSALRIKLEETQLREFTKSGDTILFTVDGFLNDSWGFMFAKGGLKMDSTWFTFKRQSIKFVEDINQNWKRTAIR